MNAQYEPRHLKAARTIIEYRDGKASGEEGLAVILCVLERDATARLTAERDDAREQLANKAADAMPHSFVNMKWACGHEGGAACVLCFNRSNAEVARLTAELDEARAQVAALVDVTVDLCDVIPDETLEDDPPLAEWCNLARKAVADTKAAADAHDAAVRESERYRWQVPEMRDRIAAVLLREFSSAHRETFENTRESRRDGFRKKADAVLAALAATAPEGESR